MDSGGGLLGHATDRICHFVIALGVFGQAALEHAENDPPLFRVTVLGLGYCAGI